MNHYPRALTSALFIIFLLGFAACSSDPLPEQKPAIPEEKTELPSCFQEKIRTQPYPKADNELFVNPAPLIVPQSMKKDALLQFALSTSETFEEGKTKLSIPREACFYNPHHRLEPGQWYWRFRSVSADGTLAGEWSESYRFEVKDDLPLFVTPGFDTFLENAPRVYPRLYCFLNGQINEARRNVASHPEYRSLRARANEALQTDYATLPNLYGNAETLHRHAIFLYQAYYLLQSNTYATKLHELLRRMVDTPPTDTELLTDNFTTTHILACHAAAYDLLQPSLTTAERTAAETLIMRVCRHFFRENCGYQENHIFDNHFWQQNLRIVFQALFLLYDHDAYSEEVRPMLEYYYDLWTSRAPAGGFNRDGLWHNGTGYFSANVKTLAYMPALLSYITRTDFLQHPWYRNAGSALLYSFPPASKTSGFGDNSEKGDAPNRLVAAFADYLARETDNAYAGWYAYECRNLVQQDYELRLYRMCADRSYTTSLPADLPKLMWYRDIGEVAMHSHPGNVDNNLVLSFRSSTFGSGSHTTASQNAFNLLFRGTDVYRSSGYYQNFADAHNLMSYRHSRAHNTILVNGIGQPYSTEGYGYVARAMGGNHISYCLGDASNAYGGISNDPMWVSYFAQAGIEQTPENGFGKTPLTKYRRHVLLLHPDIVVIYDELEASEPVRWDWLLHSPTAFEVDTDEQIVYSRNEAKQFIAATRLFCKEKMTLDITDRFLVPPAVTGEEYPDQWHCTAQVSGSRSTRLLAIIQVRDEAEGIAVIRQEGNTFRTGNWVIEAELDVEEPALLRVKSLAHPATFDYGRGTPAVSTLYDEIEGSYQTVEATDCLPALTRTGNGTD